MASRNPDGTVSLTGPVTVWKDKDNGDFIVSVGDSLLKAPLRFSPRANSKSYRDLKMAFDKAPLYVEETTNQFAWGADFMLTSPLGAEVAVRLNSKWRSHLPEGSITFASWEAKREDRLLGAVAHLMPVGAGQMVVHLESAMRSTGEGSFRPERCEEQEDIDVAFTDLARVIVDYLAEENPAALVGLRFFDGHTVSTKRRELLSQARNDYLEERRLTGQNPSRSYPEPVDIQVPGEVKVDFIDTYWGVLPVDMSTRLMASAS